MTGTPMTPDVALARLRQYGERTSTWSTATYNDGTEKALHQIAVSLAGEVDRMRARVAELEALKPAQYQECQVCGAGYEYGTPCSACEFKKQIAAATTTGPAYRSQPLPPREAMCTCGHTGLDHHHSETKCWATLPRTQQRNGTWSAVPTCGCSEFEAAP